MARVLRRAQPLLRQLLRPLPPLSSGSPSSSTPAPGCCYQNLSHTVQLRSLSAEGREQSKSDDDSYREEGIKQKDFALQQALDQITSAFGEESIMWLNHSYGRKEVPVVSTGSFALDTALGIGGLPKGRVIEIYGPEASGKTTLALHVIAEAQKTGGYCAFIDAEHALDPTFAESIGVKAEHMLLSQPDCGEQALGLADILIRSGSIDVVVVDSVAALVPKTELDGEMGDAHVALQARLMSQALRKLSHSLSRSRTILLFVNQVVGTQIQVKIVKNKHAPPFKTVQLELEFGKGLSRESEIIELGLKHKFITKSGLFYHMNGLNFHGKDAIKHYLAENRDGQEDLMAMIREKIMHDESQLDRKKEDANPDTSLTEEIVTVTDEEVHDELDTAK
ncbi:DNA repair protein recA homolog 3, mitochondrial-like isoform X4 [Phragmites australis]|uniref:DNA repair protein recA homolog 3, mitochondrial-like isoform X4 n=1 Tax=Phragmites australis TaxID=29695 RepID=UPI002D77D23B|nr:DNA repair protein recA homolog 3, mitochondrial-like isoform X4 [Phragmites australis]